MNRVSGAICSQQCFGIRNRGIVLVERIGKTSPKIAQVGKGRFRAVAQHVRTANEERGIVFEFADLWLRFLHGNDGSRILRVEIMGIADGKPGERRDLRAGVGASIALYSGIGRWSTQLYQLSRH